jgi:hypothetical protein
MCFSSDSSNLNAPEDRGVGNAVDGGEFGYGILEAKPTLWFAGGEQPPDLLQIAGVAASHLAPPEVEVPRHAI